MKRRRGGDHAGGHADERWLLTYADMITLLMALFMVMFSIASVDQNKYDELTRSLKDAFSGQVLSGGASFLEQGASPDESATPSVTPPIPAIRPPAEDAGPTVSPASQREDAELRQVQQQVEALANDRGLSSELSTQIARRGLVIRLLTDKVLFDSGSAQLRDEGRPVLDGVARILQAEVRHPIVVEGYTDKVRIATAQFPTNWELSAVRSTSVLRYLIRNGVAARRLSAAGYGALSPIDSNATEGGRRRNRRVEIVLTRLTKT